MKKMVLVLLIVLMSFSVSAACPASMVSYWTFDGDAVDDVGSNDGIITGATSTTGKLGNALSFSGGEVTNGYTGDLTPKMTSSTAPSPYRVLASSSYDTDQYWKHMSFNHVVGVTNMWLATQPLPQWITFDFGSGNSKTITKYVLKSRLDRGMEMQPKSWQLQGSNDNSAWTTLHSLSNQPVWSNAEVRTYTFSNSNSYRYYRLYITENWGSWMTGISEIEYMESIVTGSDDYVTFGSDVSLDITDEITVQAWVYPTDSMSNSGIFAKQNSVGSNYEYSMNMLNGKAQFNVWSGSEWKFAATSEDLALNQWHHQVFK